MDDLTRIANYLVLKGRYTGRLGLYHGKAGIMLAMFLYAKKSGISVFRDFAEDLLEDVQDRLVESLPAGFAEGLSGIAFAMAYLCNHGFLCFDQNEVLHDIDQKIMDTDPRRTRDISFKSGASGVWYYIQERLRSEQNVTSLDKVYIKELSNTIAMTGQTDSPICLMNQIAAPAFGRLEYVGNELGIDGGSAYYLLKDYFEP